MSATIPPQRILLAGATGLVGREVLRQALADERVAVVVAPTRKALPAHPKLVNPIVDFDHLPVEAEWWAVEGVVCTLGTTIKDAGSQAAFRKVDHDYPLAVAWHAKAAGARAYALNSSTGADPRSRFFYTRTKGEVEKSLEGCGYPSLTLARPGLLGGKRDKPRLGESIAATLSKWFRPLLPPRYRMVPAAKVAAALLDSVLSARAGVTVIESEQML